MITDKISKNKFLLIAGPCSIEGEKIALDIAEKLILITSKLSIPLVFKGSYRKAEETLRNYKKPLRRLHQSFGKTLTTIGSHRKRLGKIANNNKL